MKRKTAKAVMWGLLAVFCVFMLLMAWTRLARFGYAAIAAVIVYGIINIAFWRCPNCGRCIGAIWLGKYTHCRYCGEEMLERADERTCAGNPQNFRAIEDAAAGQSPGGRERAADGREGGKNHIGA